MVQNGLQNGGVGFQGLKQTSSLIMTCQTPSEKQSFLEGTASVNDYDEGLLPCAASSLTDLTTIPLGLEGV